MAGPGKNPSGGPTGAPSGTPPASPPDAEARRIAEAAAKHEAGKDDVISDTKKKTSDLLSNIQGGLNYAQASGLAGTFDLFFKRLQTVSASFKDLQNYDLGELIYGYDGPLKKSMASLETQLKKHVKKLTPEELARLASKKEETDKVKPNESAGTYMFRVLGFMPPAPPKNVDANAFLLQALLVKLKISDPQKKHSLIGRKEIYRGVNVPEKGYKGPILKKNDPIFFMVKIKGIRTLVGGFFESQPSTNEIRIKTVENGKIVHKIYHMRDAFFAFNAPGNTEKVAKDKAKKPKSKPGRG